MRGTSGAREYSVAPCRGRPRRRRRRRRPCSSGGRASARWPPGRPPGRRERGARRAAPRGRRSFPSASPNPGGRRKSRRCRPASTVHCVNRDGQRRGARRIRRATPSSPQAVEGRARARRRWVHRRRLRDRRAARARSAGRRPDRQPVRRLRRHERRRPDRRPGGQRRHAGADDAGGQRPGAAAVQRRVARHADAAQLPRVRLQGPAAAVPPARRGARGRPRAAAALDRGPGRSRSPTCCRPGSTRAPGSRSTSAPCSPTPTAPTTSASSSCELYLAATDLDTCERIVLGAERLGRRADLHRRARLGGAADGLPAGRGQGSRAGRRRDRLHHEPRHRGRGGGEADRGRQPAGAVRQRLHEGDPDAVRHPHAADLGHGLPEDRLPDVQAARLPAAARGRARLARALPGRRHRPDRARHRRRADVPDQHPRLPVAARGGAPRLPVGDGQAGGRLREPARGRGAARDRDLGHARAQGGAPLRGRAGREGARLAADPRADHLHAAAPVRGRLLNPPRRARRTGPRTSR